MLAVGLLATAALLGLMRTECSTVSTNQTVKTLSTASPRPAPTSQPAAPANPPASAPAGTQLPQPTSQVQETDGTTSTCSKVSVTSVPVLVLLALAGLCLSPWVKKLTVGTIGVERAEDATAPQQVVAGFEPDGGGAADGVGVRRARAAEIFVEGADLPAPWNRAGVVFGQPSMSGPDISFVKKRTSARARQLDLDDPAVQHALIAACNAAVEDPAEVAVAASGGTVERPAGRRTTVTVAAAAGRNAGGRVVALTAAVLPGDAELTEQVAAALVDVADAWARVVVDMLLQNDDGP